MQKEFESLLLELLVVNKDLNNFLKKNTFDDNSLNEESFESFNNKLDSLLEKKDVFIRALSLLKDENAKDFCECKEKFKEEWQELSNTEKDNYKLLEKNKNLISSELKNIRIGSKAVNAYKYTKEYKPRLFDDKDA